MFVGTRVVSLSSVVVLNADLRGRNERDSEEKGELGSRTVVIGKLVTCWRWQGLRADPVFSEQTAVWRRCTEGVSMVLGCYAEQDTPKDLHLMLLLGV